MKIFLMIITIIGIVALIMSIIAIINKPSSIYKNKPEERNPMEGKKVRFVENDNEIENADGVRGHLEALDDTKYQAGFYEAVVKRGFDIILSFGGLVVLSPVFLFF